MTRRKIEFVRLTNERDFPHRSNSHFRRKTFAMFCYRLVRSTVNDASQSAAAEVDTSQAGLYSILLPRHCHCGCIPQSLRWRVPDPRTGRTPATSYAPAVKREAEEEWGK